MSDRRVSLTFVMIYAHHLTAGAYAHLPLVRSEEDRHDLLARVGERLGASILAYCVMDTHLHVVAEGAADDVTRRLTDALVRYTRAYNLRHGVRGRLLRGPVASVPSTTREQLATTIHYNHDNPLRTRHPLAERQVEYPWSSAREFAGLCLAGRANVRRARQLLGTEARRALWGLDAPAVTDLDPVAAPRFALEVILGAAAAAHGLAAEAIAGDGRSSGPVAARAAYVALAGLEGFTLEQAGAAIGRSRAQACRLRAEAAGAAGVRVARTLLVTPALRRGIREAPPRSPPPAAPTASRRGATLPRRMQHPVASSGGSRAGRP